MVILDTSVVIDHLRQQGQESALDKLAKNISSDDLAISVISIQELYEGKSISDVEKENYLLNSLSRVRILPYSYEVAELAGTLNRGMSQPVGFPDMAIAATAIINEAQLFTLNVKDFISIENLELYKL